MANTCKNCKNALSANATVCPQCGTPVASQPNKPAPEKNGGFFGALWAELCALLKQPKKLIPTFILAAIWLILPLVTGFVSGANLPAVRFLCALTYAKGGVLGGFFGMVGGIFGKTIFAAVVNGFVLSLCAKKNPFAGFKKGVGGVFAGGLFAVSPLLTGAGLGLFLYWFFNSTAAPQNAAIAVAAVVAAVQAIGKQYGLLFGGVFYLLKKVSKGKAPARVTVNRLLTGLAAGFSIGFGLTFLRYAFVLALGGVLLIGAGIGTFLIGKNGLKRTCATAALLFLLSATVCPLLALPVYAKADSPSGTWEFVAVHHNPKYLAEEQIPVYDNAVLGNSEDDTCFFRSLSGDACSYTYTNTIRGEGYCSYDAHGGQKHSCNGEKFTVTMRANEPNKSYQGDETVTLDVKAEAAFDKGFCYDDSIMMYAFISLPRNNQSTSEDAAFDSSSSSVLLQDDNGESDAGVYTDAESYLCESRRIINGSRALYAEMPAGDEDHSTAYIVVVCSAGTDVGKALSYEYSWKKTATPVGGSNNTDSDETNEESDEESYETGPLGSEKGDPDYVPYRGRLTYTSGITNKHGQPFPDVMDFNKDGYIDYADLAIRQKLVHNPDYLDTPQGLALILVTLITTIIGAGAGTAAAIISSAAGTGASLGGLNLNVEFPEETEAKAEATTEAAPKAETAEDLGRFITRDADGDLTVSDPATGESRLYKANGDGTYTNPLTGATYTEADLKTSLDSRAENAELLRQDAKGQQEWQQAERERSKELSHLGQQVAEQDRAFKEQAAKEARVAEIGQKHGVYSEDANEVKKHILQERSEEYAKQAEYEATAAYAEVAEKTAETAKKIADVSADVVGAMDKTGVLKDVYSATTAAAGNAGEFMAGNMTAGQALSKTAVDASTEVLKNRASTTAGKLAANIAGDAAQDATAAIVQGKDLDEITSEAKKGAARGLVDATVDYAVDTGNSLGGADGILTDEGKALTGDLLKNAAPGIEFPKDKT